MRHQPLDDIDGDSNDKTHRRESLDVHEMRSKSTTVASILCSPLLECRMPAVILLGVERP